MMHRHTVSGLAGWWPNSGCCYAGTSYGAGSNAAASRDHLHRIPGSGKPTSVAVLRCYSCRHCFAEPPLLLVTTVCCAGPMSPTSGELPHLLAFFVLVAWLHCMLLLHCTVCTFHSFALQIMCTQSIFHVSHLRGLFPSQLFKTVDMPNLGGDDTDVVLNATGHRGAVAQD